MPTIKDRIVINFCIRTWRMWERLGIHISPNHFYWPIPDTKDILRHDFNKKFSIDGIKIDDSRMQELLKKLALYKSEYSAIHTNSAYASNGDGAILYSMVREFKPKRILEDSLGCLTEEQNRGRQVKRINNRHRTIPQTGSKGTDREQ